MKKILMSSVAIVAVSFLVGSLAFAKKESADANDNSSKSKSEKVKELKNFEKPTKEKTNASIHKEKTDEVSSGLLDVAEVEKNKGQQNREEKTNEKKINNPDVGAQEQVKEKTRDEIATELEDVASQTEEVQDETIDAIEEIEDRSGFKKFLVGTDYKNLGQLRSSLVQNRNQIRKLTGLSGDITDEDAKLATQEQLTILMQERERIKTVISENEGGFSLFGWVSRFMNNYPKVSIDDEEETQLIDEVVAVTEEVVTEPENTEEEVIEERTTEEDTQVETVLENK